MSFSSITGHHDQIEILKKTIINNKVSHAYLLLGQDGIGKRLVAHEFSKALNCNDLNGDSCDRCTNCKKINAMVHPDVEIVEPEGRFIKIGIIREMQKRLQFKPLEGRFKVVIIDEAEKINMAAANALLKTLEEPPDRTVIILVSSGANNLLPTVISRCQRLNFHPLFVEDAVRLIREKGDVDESLAAILASFGQGSVGRALSLDREWIENGRKAFLEDIVGIIQGDMVRVFQLAEDMYMGDSFMEHLEALKGWIRDLLVYKYCKDGGVLINSDLLTTIDRESNFLSSERLLSIFQRVNECQKDILRNANKRLALEVMFMEIGCPLS